MAPLLDQLANFGFTQLDSLIRLANGLPKLITAELSKEDNLGPVVGAVIAPLVEKLVYGAYDELTGTADSDISYSDYVSTNVVTAMTKRDSNRAYRTLKSDYGGFAGRSSAGEQADKLVEAVVDSIYGSGSYNASLKNSVAAQGFRILNSRQRKETYTAGIKAIADAEVFGADLGVLTQAREAEAQERLFQARMADITEELRSPTLSSDRQAALTAELGVVRGQAAAAEAKAKNLRSEATTLVQSVGEATQQMTYGYVDDRGNFVKPVTKTLTDSEIRTAIADFAKGGGFSGSNTDANIAAMKDYIAKIANGVDNIKQVLGDDVGMQDAMMIVSAMSGTSAAAYDAKVFNSLTTQFKNLAYNSGITDKDWATGVAAAMHQLTGYGVPQVLSSAAGLNIAALYATARNTNLGVADKEYKQMLAQQGTEIIRDGSLQNVGTIQTALQAFGKSDQEIEEIITKLRKSRNVYDIDKMIEQVSAATGLNIDTLREVVRLYHGNESVLQKMTNPALMMGMTADNARDKLTEASNKFAQNLNMTFDIERGTFSGSNDQSKALAEKLNSALNGRKITDLTEAELNDLLVRYNREHPDKALTPVELATVVNERSNIEHLAGGYGTVSGLNAWVSLADKPAAAVVERFRNGSSGIVQYLSSVSTDKGKADLGELISVALTGTTGNFKNDSVIREIYDELKNGNLDKVKLTEAESRDVTEEIGKRLRHYKKYTKSDEIPESEEARIRTEVETQAKLLKMFKARGVELIDNRLSGLGNFFFPQQSTAKLPDKPAAAKSGDANGTAEKPESLQPTGAAAPQEPAKAPANTGNPETTALNLSGSTPTGDRVPVIVHFSPEALSSLAGMLNPGLIYAGPTRESSVYNGEAYS